MPQSPPPTWGNIAGKMCTCMLIKCFPCFLVFPPVFQHVEAFLLMCTANLPPSGTMGKWRYRFEMGLIWVQIWVTELWGLGLHPLISPVLATCQSTFFFALSVLLRIRSSNPLWHFRISFASGRLPTGSRWTLWHNEKCSIAEMGENQHLTDQWGVYISCLLPTFVTRSLSVTWYALELLIVTACVIWDSYASKLNVFIDRCIRTLNMGCFHLKNTLIRNQKERSLSLSKY